MASCTNNDPVACFALDKDVEAREAYQFRNCSVNAGDFSWEFGDGEISNEENPTHTWNEVGVYQVKLTVNNKGTSDEIVRAVNVFLDDLTAGSDGLYTGKYIETYPDSLILNKTYNSTATISILSHKQIELSLSRGQFKSIVSGDPKTGYTFSEGTEFQPSRLQEITSVSGTYTKIADSLAFSLTGFDPQFGSTRWIIRFNGTKN